MVYESIRQQGAHPSNCNQEDVQELVAQLLTSRAAITGIVYLCDTQQA
jgi:hypothetical protein